jgi:hypothetical protein
LILWEPCYSDVKVVAIPRMNMPDEVSTMRKAPFYGLPFILTSRWIPAECQDIPAAVQLGFLTNHQEFCQPVNRKITTARTRNAMSTFSLGI